VTGTYKHAIALGIVQHRFLQEVIVSKLNQAAKGQGSEWVLTGDEVLAPSRLAFEEVIEKMERNPLQRTVAHFFRDAEVYSTRLAGI
jgi:hypothetical protein